MDRIKELFALGENPFGSQTCPNLKGQVLTIQKSLESFDRNGKLNNVVLRGRITEKNDLGGLVFLVIQDHTGKIQVILDRKSFHENKWKAIKLCALFDFIEVVGDIIRSNKGNIISIAATSFNYKGACTSEIEHKSNKKLLAEKIAIRKKIEIREASLYALRKVLKSENFLEVESNYSIKTLLESGFDKIFQTGKSEYECCSSFSHYESFFRTCELFCYHASFCSKNKKLQTTWFQHPYGLPNPCFEKVTFEDLFKEKIGVSLFDKDRIAEIAVQTYIPFEDHWDRVRLIFRRIIQPFIKTPTFVLRPPEQFCDFSRPSEIDARFCDRFDLYCSGILLASGYNGINDPELQMRKLRSTAKKKAEKWWQDKRAFLGLDEKKKSQIMQYAEQHIDHQLIQSLLIGIPEFAYLNLYTDSVLFLTCKWNGNRQENRFSYDKSA